jgi:hypothetical protein
MSTAEIIEKLPGLTRDERREIARRIFDLEEESNLLADCDARADSNFQLLDRMEAEDARTDSR